MNEPERNLAAAREYLQALENFATGDELARFFAPNVVQTEFPNRLAPQGAQRSLPELLAGAERGKQLLARQTFDLKRAVAQHDTVALELVWTGVLAVPLGTLPAGAELRANIATFLEFADGRITAQRNYDCYES